VRLKIERSLMILLRRLQEHFAGEGVRAYLVGGSLRDILLGRPVRDIDLAVAADPLAVSRELAELLGGAPVPLDAERGVARVVLPANAPITNIDLTPLHGDIESDLARRDFTVDAMAVPLDGLGGAPKLIDPCDGEGDLERRLVRAADDDVFRDDGLRLLRGIRLCAELGFSLEESTAARMRRDAGHLRSAAPERQRDELARMLATARAGEALRRLDEIGLLDIVFPEVTAARGVEQPKEHYWNVFDHALETVAAFDWMLGREPPAQRRQAAYWRELWQQLGWYPGLRDHFDEEVVEGRSWAVLLKLAGLLHDVSKPETRAPDKTGRIRFFGHAKLGAEKAGRVMRRLRFSGREAKLVALMVREHLRPMQLANQGPPTRRALYRYFRDTGDAAVDVLLLTLADHCAARGPRMRLDGWRNHITYVRYILARRHLDETLAAPPRLLTGNDVMQTLGVGPGPAVGRILAAVAEAQGAGEIATREEALALVSRLAAEEGVTPAASVASARSGG
jgi:poly(A) polymerase